MNHELFVSNCSQDLLFSQNKENIVALKYLCEKRHITTKTIKDFLIGYCQNTSLNNSKINKKIRGHIIVPIRSEFGAIIAVATRQPSSDEKGWWNQSFAKKNYLFMLDATKKYIFKNNKAYIFEGYFDSIISYQFGLKNVCSLMSTNLGHRRIGLLARYCDHICLCYDSDLNSKAGQIAQFKSIHEMHQYGWENISKINLPIGVDPDEFIIRYGVDSFLKLEKKLSKKDIANASKQYEFSIKKDK